MRIRQPHNRLCAEQSFDSFGDQGALRSRIGLSQERFAQVKKLFPLRNSSQPGGNHQDCFSLNLDIVSVLLPGLNSKSTSSIH